MQDIHSIGGGGARLFGGGGDRRLRPHQNNQALKCPRCDSLNTKFCYYNNYNLSQPRHFCKSCRRYWTKGGVLRNVPVGGGCRKTKRSKPKQPPATPSSPPEAVTTAVQQEDVQHSLNNYNNNNNAKSSNSHSTSESSSLTATNTTTTANTTIEAVSSKATTPTNNNNAMFSARIDVETSKLFSTNPSFEQAIYEQYPDIGSLTGLMSTSSSENIAFGYGNMMNQQTTTSVQAEQQQGLWEGGFDEVVKNELKTMQNGGSRGVESGGGFGGLDWQGSGDQGLFHIPNPLDQAYWTQNQWSADQDHHPALYLP